MQSDSSSDSVKPVIRDALPSDMAFIYSTWLRDLRKADGGPLPDDCWFGAHRELINRVLTDTKVVCLVVCPSDAPNEILGYVVGEPDEVLWWVYLKPRYRTKFGLCKLLLESAKAESAVAAFSTPDAKSKLKNPRRPRQLRSRYSLKTASP